MGVTLCCELTDFRRNVANTQLTGRPRVGVEKGHWITKDKQLASQVTDLTEVKISKYYIVHSEWFISLPFFRSKKVK